jgi:HEAT repeat protein
MLGSLERRMGNRLSLDDKLAAIRRLRDEELTPENKSQLRRGIGDRSNLVVAAAAAIAGARALIDMAADLEAAFGRFVIHPVKDDKLCRAKIAIVQALDKLEHQNSEVFQKAATYVQFEPVWGGEEDTAGPLRAAALIALARLEGSGVLTLLIDALVDPLKDVRIAAAQALGYLGTGPAGLLLRLKARIGDSEPEVLSECYSGLLTIDPKEYLPFVSEVLATGGLARGEAAAIALGNSRLPEAFDVLKSCWERSSSSELGEQVLLAIAMLRLPVAIDYLLALVASDSEDDALEALSVLKIHRYDPNLRARVAKLVEQKDSRALQGRFDRDFRADD